MKPPYTVTPTIANYVVLISERIGTIRAIHLYKPPTELRKKNRIHTIQSSLEIEGNTLTEEQVTALMDGKRVFAPGKDILEVQNAIAVYQDLKAFDAYRMQDLERAHGILMKGLVDQPGVFRTRNVGIVKGAVVEHMAPNGSLVRGLMKDLFHYLNEDNELLLIKSCVFHYEFEFIHPFIDGNGRMGRLWQTALLMRQYPVFEYLPIEHLIKQQQQLYYGKLAESDKLGQSTPFVEFMLKIILQALDDLLLTQRTVVRVEDRIELFRETIGKQTFSRKDYLYHYKSISAPTASRDLKWAVDQGLLVKEGDKRLTTYRFSKV